jgi:hydrogenase maturation protease
VTRVLVVGYGNTLRADDGVGCHVADRLAADPRLDGATVLGCHQLTPELAVDLSRADLAVLVDAAHGPAAGTFSVRPMGDAAKVGSAFSHHVDPATLVALTRELYGHAPEVVLVSVGVASVELGEGLSPAVEAAIPAIVDAVVAVVRARRPPRVPRGTRFAETADA